MPVAKHPGFGRYFGALFEAVAGLDLMTSFDRLRAESSPALALKLVAASTTAIIPKDPKSDFALIVEPLLSIASTLSRQSAIGTDRNSRTFPEHVRRHTGGGLTSALPSFPGYAPMPPAENRNLGPSNRGSG